MRVRRVGKRVWEVLAIESDDGHCYALEFLGSLPKAQENHAIKMLSWLEQIIPSNGPPREEPHCKRLAKNLYELRRNPGRGPVLRILWFEHAGKVVVCTHGFLKDQPKTDQGEIDRAIDMRERYLKARDLGQLTIVDA